MIGNASLLIDKKGHFVSRCDNVYACGISIGERKLSKIDRNSAVQDVEKIR
jgi:hypothetical protein